MNVTVLGCSGGIGGTTPSTCVQVTPKLLIDAGSGLERMALDNMRRIDHILLTHAHMDHISALATFLSNVIGYREQSVRLYAQTSTIEVLRKHIFNWQVWPDFTVLPTVDQPIIEFVPLQPGKSVAIDGLHMTPIAMEHTVPTIGFSIRSDHRHFMYCADTTYNANLIDALNQLPQIDQLVIECSFPRSQHEMAMISKHLTTDLLKRFIDQLNHRPHEILVAHLKPNYEALIRAELSEVLAGYPWRYFEAQ
ncbi:MAG TPA: 3',5'-cyclic-nucleotide phosphodiesterase [Pseudidiomarina sp.]|nr:3',5'-cyclic-nucleotide phosphodiesterase [Pseudidiomarina sp.]